VDVTGVTGVTLPVIGYDKPDLDSLKADFDDIQKIFKEFN
jgi:hypothetical protein